MSGVLAIDRGNHSVKAALFRDGGVVKRWRGLEAAEEIADWAGEASADGAAVSSVVPKWDEECGEVLRASGIADLVFAAYTSDWPFTIDLASPETVGPDRLCAAAGAMAEGADDAVIVDAGSAVTVDLLKNGSFIGGSIMPGLDMMLKSLSENTAVLPRITAGVDLPGPPGRDTETALRAGTAGALIGGVLRLIELSNALFDIPPAIFVTGGDASLVLEELPPFAKHTPDLVLSGLNLLYSRKFG